MKLFFAPFFFLIFVSASSQGFVGAVMSRFEGCSFKELKPTSYLDGSFPKFVSKKPCKIKIAHYQNLCNRGGVGGESGARELGACNFFWDEKEKKYYEIRTEVIDSWKWGSEIEIEATVTIEDYEKCKDCPTEYDLSLSNVTLKGKKAASLNACFEIDFGMTMPVQGRSLQKIISESETALGVKINCDPKGVCGELYKLAQMEKVPVVTVCYDSSYSKLKLENISSCHYYWSGKGICSVH